MRKLTLEQKEHTIVKARKRPAKLANQAFLKQRTLHEVRRSRTAKARQQTEVVEELKRLLITLTFGKVASRKKLKQIAKGKKKPGPERTKVPKDFHTNRHGFKLRWSPFKESAHTRVHPQVYYDVHDLLREDLMTNHGISLDRGGQDTTVLGAPQGPMHAGDAVTVDALVRVILSQATTNGNALAAQARLQDEFAYFVDGKKVVGNVPDYHEVRTADLNKVIDTIAVAGFQNKRAKQIQGCLNIIYQKNKEANSPNCHIDSNPPGTKEFVPGSLSLAYLNDMSPQEKFDELSKMPGIGIKTIACILCFNFQLPVFAVDTHVFRMVKWLGWVPDGADRDDSSAYLDEHIPDELKYALHQGFWHHGQRCVRCKAGNGETSAGWADTVCVLEEFLNRDPPKERKSPVRKRKMEEESSEESESPKAKIRKGNKIMMANMTPEEAEAGGYQLREIVIEDNFNTLGSNVTGVKVAFWMK